MPVPAYSWQLDDWPSASRLNGELFRTGGQPFQPNGTGFHAARPVYKSFSSLGAALSGAWQQQGHTNSPNALTWPVLADTGALFGSRMDPIEGGTILCNVQNSGGAQNSKGGLGLVSTFIATAAAPAGGGTVNCGLGVTGLTSPSTAGTGQLGNTSFPTSVWALDIMDLNGSGPITPYAISTQTSPSAGAFSADGSGAPTLLQAHWASVYPANGTKVSALPALTTSITGTTPLTAAMFNQNIQQLMNLLNMPPLVRVQSTGTTSCASGTLQPIGFPAATYDTYGGWSAGRDMYTVPLPGIYLVAGFVPFSIGTSSHVSAAVNINGNTFWGPAISISGAFSSGAAKVGMFDLNAGDTIQLAAQQQSGSSQNALPGSILVVLYLGAQGIGSPVPSLPDPNYFFIAGTPASQNASVLSQHMANDLNFLLNKPYFLGWQSVAQTGATQGSATALNLDKIQGLVHATAGDPWSGWNATTKAWAAPVPGWYLAVEEIFAVPPTLANASCAAQLALSVPGLTAQDSYQQNNCASGVTNTGAAAVGYYYLRAGDTITPMFTDSGFFSSGTAGTNVAGGTNSHLEIVWIGS